MSTEPKLIDGEVNFVVSTLPEKPCKTKYWISGNLKSGITPLVVLHGGPGGGHDYLSNMALLTERHGIPVVLYDQIGCGQSTHYPEKMGHGAFWSTQLFIEELVNLLNHLGIHDNFDLLGHSWGGMLAASFAVQQPKGLRRLVLASGIAIMQDWVDSSKLWKAGLPQEVLDTLNKHEAEGTTASKEYEDAIAIFYGRHMCRLNPMPEGLIKTFVSMKEDPTVCVTMKGPDEFFIAGTLKTFDVTPGLHKINVPTLLTNGRYDTANDPVQERFFKNIPHVKWVEFAESSHTPHHEEAERYLKVVGDFLKDA